jgi:hypothetical protein
MRPRVRRARRGGYVLDLPPEEREVLRGLAPQLVALLEEADPASAPWLIRLFPVAYPQDEERDAEYRRLMHEDLKTRHLQALRTMEATVDATELGEEEVLAWLGALNELRLVLGTRLDVSEETTDDDFEPGSEEEGIFGLYVYLGWLQEQVVAVLDPKA